MQYSHIACFTMIFLTLYFRGQKRASAPAGQAAEVPEVRPETEELPVKPDITKDADSDFAELNPLDDIDVSDQLVYKAAVRIFV